MNRNANDHFNKLPVPNFPRTRHSMPIFQRKTSQGHGLLTPFFIAPVYPGDTWNIDMAAQVRADVSARVPLDEIYDDIYFFFVPYRLLDKDFVKVLGDKDDPYDTTQYSFPKLAFDNVSTETDGLNFLPYYLGYHNAIVNISGPQSDEVCAYPVAAYWKIWNDYFKDEHVDASIPFEDLYNTSDLANPIDPTTRTLSFAVGDKTSIGYAAGGYLQLARVNKFHDYFTSALTSAVDGPETLIPMNMAPVGAVATSAATITAGGSGQFKAGTYAVGDFASMEKTGATWSQAPIVADVQSSAGTIAQLTLAMQLYQLYHRRAVFGHRYIEQLRGMWGLEVSDYLVGRSEYLGGTQVTLNNIPVLDTTSSGLGTFAGNSQTTFAGASFTKSMVEYGLLIGLSVTRIKHTYGQGCDPTLWDIETDLDLYNPLMANIGNVAIKNREIFNDPGSIYNDQVFAYQESWSRLRAIPSDFSGFFAPLANSTTSQEIREKFGYQDLYPSLPSFGSSWLKEGDEEVRRTLTGRLIPGSTSAGGHQFLFNYMVQPTVTRILPAHAHLLGLLNRL